MHSAKKHISRLTTSNVSFLQCDIQTIFKDKIYNVDSVVRTAKTLNKAAGLLKTPLIITEHYTKAFGHTLPEIKETWPAEGYELFEKTLFSMITPDVKKALEKHNERKNIVLYGIETHVCIQQTTLDLLELGYDVHLPVDGVSSQRKQDREAALVKLRKAGAFLTTSESLLFELCRDAKSENFKKLAALFKMDRNAIMDHL
mmetsp:Transcript_16963/g.19398  ORF Transcript_16963/g.19398 Transcript_16963/m.19398 type:complete len:201 (+) Transcript_16963:20-622(+)